MEEGQQQTPAEQPQPSPGLSHKKVFQPSQSLLDEMKVARPATPSQPQPTPQSISQQETPVSPLLPPSASVSSAYPVATKGVLASAPIPPPIVGANVSNEQKPITSTSPPVLAQVPALKTLVLLGVGLYSLQLFILLIYRGKLLGALAILSFTTHGLLMTILSAAAYAAQVSVIISMLLFLALTLSKSFKTVHKLLTLALVVNVLVGIVNLIAGDITGIVFTLIVVGYIANVRGQVDVTEIGGQHEQPSS